MTRTQIVVFLVSIIIFIGIGTSAEAHQRWTWGRTPGIVQGQACGGDLPPCYVMKRESTSKAYPGGGDPHIWNPNSSASGKWQFIRGTWGNFKGYRNAADAPAYIQDQKARIVWNMGRGCSNWRAC